MGMKLQLLLTACLAVSTISVKLRNNKKKLVYQLAMKEIGQCWVKNCQTGCYSSACISCKNDCRTALTENEQIWNGKVVSSRKFCNLTCKTEKKCPRKRDLPKTCKKCKKQCFRDAIEQSQNVQKFVGECKRVCDAVCWGPNWKSEGCTE